MKGERGSRARQGANGIFPTTKVPITAPTRTPVPMPASAATPGECPARSAIAETIVPSAIVEPTERSMPPETMISVAPIAAVPTTAVWRSIKRWFAAETKSPPARAAKRSQAATRPRAGPARRRNALKRSPRAGWSAGRALEQAAQGRAFRGSSRRSGRRDRGAPAGSSRRGGWRAARGPARR